MYCKSRSSKVFLLLLPSIIAIAITANGQNNASRQPSASVTILDSTKEQDGLMGSVRRIKTESAKLEFKAGVVVEGAKQLVEITTYALTGNRIENVSYPVSSTSVGREEYKYDDKGHIIEMTLRGEGGAILSREAYDYEFDRFGNWTKMITSLVVFEDGKLKREPIEVTYRTLTYYFDDSIATAVSTPARKKTPVIPSTASPLASAARLEAGPIQLKDSATSSSVSVPVGTPPSVRSDTREEKLVSSSKSETVRENRPAPVELVEPEPQPKEKTPAREPQLDQPRTDEAGMGNEQRPPAAARDTAAGTNLGNSVKTAVISEAKTQPVAAKTTSAEAKTPPAENMAASTLAMNNYKKASELFQVGDMNGAVTAYLQAIDLEPKSAEYRLALGHAYLKLQKDKEAAKALKESVRLNPEVAEAQYGLGLAYFRLNRHKDAADAFKKATLLHPEMAKAHYGLALAYQELGKQDALIEQYRILQKLDSNLAKQLAQAFPNFNLQCRVPPFCKK